MIVVLSVLQKDVARRDQKLDHIQNELQLQIQEKESITRALKQQIADLHERLRMIGETGANLKARVATQDKRMAKLEGKILQTSSDRDSSVSSQVRVLCLEVHFKWWLVVTRRYGLYRQVT